MSSTYPDPGTCLWSPGVNIVTVMIDRADCMTAVKGSHQLQIRNLTIRAHLEKSIEQRSHRGKDTCLCRVGRIENTHPLEL